jgi:hypothetical protein
MSKTVAKQAEQNRRRELELGFNGVADVREERVRSVQEIATKYLEQYWLRNKSGVFARYAVGHPTRHLGKIMSVDVNERTGCGIPNGSAEGGRLAKDHQRRSRTFASAARGVGRWLCWARW